MARLTREQVHGLRCGRVMDPDDERIRMAYLALLDEIEELEYNVSRGWNIVELAVRNQSVSDYIDHWESRAMKAESTLARREAQTCGTCCSAHRMTPGYIMCGWNDTTWTTDESCSRWQAKEAK